VGAAAVFRLPCVRRPERRRRTRPAVGADRGSFADGAAAVGYRGYALAGSPPAPPREAGYRVAAVGAYRQVMLAEYAVVPQLPLFSLIRTAARAFAPLVQPPP